MLPWSTLTRPVIGDCMLPSILAIRTSRDGKLARALTPFSSMTFTFHQARFDFQYLQFMLFDKISNDFSRNTGSVWKSPWRSDLPDRRPTLQACFLSSNAGHRVFNNTVVHASFAQLTTQFSVLSNSQTTIVYQYSAFGTGQFFFQFCLLLPVLQRLWPFHPPPLDC